MLVYFSSNELRTAFPEAMKGHIGRLLNWAATNSTTGPVSSRLKPYSAQYRNLYTQLLHQPDAYRKKISHKFIRGIGVDIGALHKPFPSSGTCEIIKVDLCSREKLLRFYPELPPDTVTSPNIIADGENLNTFRDDSLDFIIASHVVEHLRNPIGAITSWTRTLRGGGYLILIIPHKNFTFDRDRPVTPISHLINDAEHPSKERDFNHYVEFIEVVHKKTGKDIEIEAQKLLESRYSIHMHVFDYQTWYTFLSTVQGRFRVPLTVVETLDLGKEQGEIMTVMKKQHLIPLIPIKNARGLAKGAKIGTIREEKDRV
jgi:predicted SAM-dependent methyltransferase